MYLFDLFVEFDQVDAEVDGPNNTVQTQILCLEDNSIQILLSLVNISLVDQN